VGSSEPRYASAAPRAWLAPLLALALACQDPDAGSCPPAPPAASEAPPPVSELAGVEQPDLIGDFEVVDPSADITPSLEGLVTTLSDLPVPVTRLTMRYVEHFGTSDKGRQAFFERFHRSSRYQEHFARKLRELDLPEDLMWLAAIESGFNPQAVSPAGAVGLFQIMPVTAERFGLAMGPELDERRSVVRSSDAAFSYLAILKEQLGSWDLALAAYNCGEGRLLEAMDAARNKLGLEPHAPVAFHELASQKVLPRETAHFVPMIHAFAIVVSNRQLLVLDDEQPYDPLRFTEIAVPAGTRLGVIAKAADISIATLREHNPDLLTDRLPPGKGDLLVQIPTDYVEQTLAALPALLEREAELPVSPPLSSVVVDAQADEKPRTAGIMKKKNDAAEVAKRLLDPVSSRPNTYQLASGVFVELKDEPLEALELSARVVVVDPTNDRKPTGKSHELEVRKVKPAELDEALRQLKKDLQRTLTGPAALDLREHLAGRRRGLYARRGRADVFAALSQRAFPEGHPMAGALLVGTTDRDDDPFLEIEPPWALEATVTVRGDVTPETTGLAVEAALRGVFEPEKLAKSAFAGRVALGADAKDLLIGWASPPLRDKDETAMHVAFLLACQPKLGVAYKALRQGQSIAAEVACALELSPQATVGWIAAKPIEPATISDVEGAIDAAIAKLVSIGPTDVDLEAARAALKITIARERELAKLRGIPRGWVVRNGQRIRSKLKGRRHRRRDERREGAVRQGAPRGRHRRVSVTCACR
jgi:hypothetical protein